MYEQYYSISTKPFQLTPDPRFFYASNKHKQALSYLEYGLEQGEGFIVITGPVGTGKTTIAQNLLHSINNDAIQAVQIVTSKLSPKDLLTFIAKEFSLEVTEPTKAALLASIEHHLVSLNKLGKRAVLLVDEAQNLPIETIEELRMLSNFQRDNKPLLQSFLLGQEELKDILMSPDLEQFRQRIIASCHLQALTPEEIKEYILHRLKLVGCDRPELFSDNSFSLIHGYTQGIPRKINVLTDRVLLYGFLNEIKVFHKDDIQSVINEMSLELSSSVSSLPKEKKIKLHENVEQINNTDKLNNELRKSLQEVDDYLQELIDKKLKMNRYLDRILEQKNIAIAEDNEKNIAINE